jgi:hypothetical protein
LRLPQRNTGRSGRGRVVGPAVVQVEDVLGAERVALVAVVIADGQIEQRRRRYDLVDARAPALAVRNTGRTEGSTTAAGQAGFETSTGKSRSVGAPVPFELGQVLPPQVRAESRLTEKQQKEVAGLEKEVKDRLNQILNKGQKQQLAAMGLPERPEPEGGADRHQPAPRAAMSP